jgi:hypothetical protein
MDSPVRSILLAAALSLSSLLAAGPAAGSDPWSPRPREATVLGPRLEELAAANPGADLKAWVFFTDKQIADQGAYEAARGRFVQKLDPRSIMRRLKMGDNGMPLFHDLPVHQPYVDQVLALGARKRALSRYLNAVSVAAPIDVLRAAARLPMVARIEPVRAGSRRPVEPDRPAPAPSPRKRAYTHDYGPSLGQLEMIQVPAVHDQERTGEGIRICLLDTGFKRTHEALQGVILLAERDFINDDGNTGPEPGDPAGQYSHGTKVLSLIAGYQPGELYGPAFGAEYLLGKTEDTSQEQPIEEDWWVEGIEWADSLGADIVSSSLGYKDWYTYEDMDGNTAVTTVAADIAARNGILVCTSAGNEGNSEWVRVIAPADADSTIATGAVWSDTVIASFSSRGPTYDGRIKPDLVAQGVYAYSADPDDDHGYAYCHGTSCSNPLLAGAAALVLAANPFLTPFEVIANLKATATQALSPDTAMGWGLIRTADAVARVTAVVEGQDLERWGDKPAPLPQPLTIQASPNPSNPTVQLRIEVAAATPLVVRVYDARGALVDTVFNESVEPGTHDLVWDGKTGDGRDVPSGVYFARAEALRTSVTQKVSLVR